MALTERYVTQAAAGGGDGTSGDPWTFAEAITNAVAGDRINIQSDGAYSIGATTFGAGTFAAPIIWRGYDTTIGDLDDLGRNANGTLNTTGMPAITITSGWTMGIYVVVQNLNVTGALSTRLIGDKLKDNWGMISCRIENTQNNAAAKAIEGDNHIKLINCDFICSGAAHGIVVDMDASSKIHGCRFVGTASSVLLRVTTNAIVLGSVFIKTGTLGGSGIHIDAIIVGGSDPVIYANTFYNLTDGILSTATHTAGNIITIHNHATDCTKFINNTTNITCYDIQNRTRDNTTPSSTVELITAGAITTDTGGSETDYLDDVSGDFHLITTAPGYNAGWDGSDIGGLQTDPPAGGGGLRLVGSGGLVA